MGFDRRSVIVASLALPFATTAGQVAITVDTSHNTGAVAPGYMGLEFKISSVATLVL